MVKKDKPRKTGDNLAKTHTVLARNLATLIKEIEAKNEEKAKVETELTKTREKYQQIAGREGKIESELKEKQSALKQEIGVLKRERASLESWISASKEYLFRCRKEGEEEKRRWQDKADTLKSKLSSIQDDIATAEKAQKRARKTLKQLEEKTLTAGAIKKEIADLIRQRAEEERKLDNIISKCKEELAKLDHLKQYKAELEERDRALFERERQIAVMEERLKPEYLEVFGKYANLDNK